MGTNKNYSRHNTKIYIIIGIILSIFIFLVVISIDYYKIFRQIVLCLILLFCYFKIVIYVISKTSLNVSDKDKYYMKIAYKEAEKALKTCDVPIGCIIVLNDKIISKAFSTTKSKYDERNHAECLAIKKALHKLNIKKDFSDVGRDIKLYTTSEPCPMCKGLMIYRGIKKMYYGEIHCRPKKNIKYWFNELILLINSRGGIYSEKHYNLIKMYKDLL